MNEQNIAGEDAVLRKQAYRIRSVARGMEDAQFLVAHFKRLTIFNMDTDVRSRRQTMHHDWRAGQFAQPYRAAAMIGVRVGVDDRLQAPSVISEDREVALDLVMQRIDDGGLAAGFRDRQIGFTLAPIEFAKDHVTAPPISRSHGQRG